MLDGGRSYSDRGVFDVTRGRNGRLRENHGAGDGGQSAWVRGATGYRMRERLYPPGDADVTDIRLDVPTSGSASRDIYHRILSGRSIRGAAATDRGDLLPGMTPGRAGAGGLSAGRGRLLPSSGGDRTGEGCRP